MADFPISDHGVAPEAPASGSRMARQQHKRRKLLFWLRLTIILIAFLGLWHLAQRFELVKLPEDACSPVSSFEPGVSLLVDRAPEVLYLGDVVLFELPGGALGLGRISPPPGSAPDTLRTESGYWILGDSPDCPVPDSRAHGTFPDSAIAARVLFPIRF